MDILKYMGSQLMLDSTPGEGSTFTIALPEARNIVDGFSGDGNDIFFDEGDEIF